MLVTRCDHILIDSSIVVVVCAIAWSSRPTVTPILHISIHKKNQFKTKQYTKLSKTQPKTAMLFIKNCNFVKIWIATILFIMSDYLVEMKRYNFLSIVAIRSYNTMVENGSNCVIETMMMEIVIFKHVMFIECGSHCGFHSCIVLITSSPKVFYNANFRCIVSRLQRDLPSARLVECMLWGSLEIFHRCILCQQRSWAQKWQDCKKKLAPV